jgi:type I restriction enzyme S subunit
MASQTWRQLSLGKVITLQRGYDLPQRERKRGTIPIISSSGVIDTHNHALVKGPGVVTGRYGTIGEVFFVEEDFWPLNTTLFVKDFKGNNPLFISYLLHTIDYKSYSGKSGVPGVNRNDLHEIGVSLPPLPEQRAIANALSDVDALITSLDKLIAKKRDIKQATMQQLLTGKTRLPGFSGEWEVKKLGEIAEIIMGQSPLGTSYNRDGNGYPLINGPTEFTDKHPIKIQWTDQPTKFCKKNDVLLCVRGSSTGRINIADDDYCIGRGVAAIRAKSEIDGKYITFQVKCAVVDILALTTGSTFPNIDGKSIRSISFPLPSLPEQQAIAQILSDIDAEIAALEQKRDKTRALKQGMMQELLTGKTRLL